ncbi:MAG TPA: response regulator, partial [Betaproteobacteria bacterium]|nr:response regulator [Betaproteobacteria bacterium]
MTPDYIPPFYYPTTVLFVDDNAAFLANLSLQLSGGLAYRLHSSPLDALLEINAPASGAPAARRYFSLGGDTGAQPLWRHAIDLHLDKIHREVHNERRFGQIAVAVVDFDMPEIDGLAFCRNIKSPAVKKLLLTGKADEKIAVKAFNQGIIDRFIMKHESDATARLNQAIAELQCAHFRQSERMLADALSIGTHDFLCDPGFAGVFRDIRQQLRIVEF